MEIIPFSNFTFFINGVNLIVLEGIPTMKWKIPQTQGKISQTYKAFSIPLNKNYNSVLIRIHNSFKACLWGDCISSSKLLIK